ncbi:MAG: glutamine-hydrolyzing carbamoyl-phosphate synthase small subunit [Ignavibacteria bacterium]|nr:glutamine-hydrolyzing carbamoyl-phosphate synthase small subunit [Ignavibacteria bacterium]
MEITLVLENGIHFTGESFGAVGEISGEVVFNTSLTGYQEILTDPSYSGQIVTMTYPLIGNYGVNPEDNESLRPQASGLIVREYQDSYSNFRATQSLGSWLEEHGVIGIQGIDTRMLTRILRNEGSMRGILSTTDGDRQKLLKKVNESPSMNGLDLATVVSVREPYSWDDVDKTPFALPPLNGESKGRRYRVVAMDCGIKHNIMRRLTSYGCQVTVVPADFPAEEILAMDPDGIFLSNGPGDPAPVRVAIANIRKLIGKKPIFGICLGHQLIALALGGRTFKLKFGHRGANHPVKKLSTGEIEITSQNHGFSVDPDSLDPEIVELTHVNLNDGTNEGFRHRELPLFSVQYHPEASPGPHDSDYLFRDFIRMMKTGAPVISTSVRSVGQIDKTV